MAVTALWPYGGPGIPYGSFAGKTAAPEPEVDATTYTGGWPSYGYRRKKRSPVEEIEEKIESQQIEIEDIQSRIAKERAQQEKIEAKARRDKADQTALLRLKAGIAADLQVIEEMRRIHDELLTLKALEQYADTKRRKRNQLTAILMA